MSDVPVTDYDIETGVYPTDLLARERWFCWAYDDGRKIPRAPWETGGDQWISWKEKSLWTDFETASEWRDKMDGFELASCIPPRESNAEERLILFDFDNCRDPATGAIHPHAWAFLIGDEREALHGALSTSGTGIHGYAWAPIPADLKPSWTHELADWTEFDGYDESPFDETPELECYAADRFIALTGDHIAETPTAVPELNETVHDMFLKFGTERVVGTAREPDTDRSEVRDMDSAFSLGIVTTYWPFGFFWTFVFGLMVIPFDLTVLLYIGHTVHATPVL